MAQDLVLGLSLLKMMAKVEGSVKIEDVTSGFSEWTLLYIVCCDHIRSSMTSDIILCMITPVIFTVQITHYQ